MTSGNGTGVPFLRRKLAGARRFVRDPIYRRIKLLAWFERPGLFQPFGTTHEDRYPRIFAGVRDLLGGRTGLRILSFGCATGEEVFTLRRYFPDADTKGVDINADSIGAARRRLAAEPDPRIEFAEGSSAVAEAPASYDAIFCMAVLRDGRLGSAPPRCDHLLRFADFERIVEEFARALKPGGLLAIRHSNFRFSDAPVARDFETVLSVPFQSGARSTPLYGPDNRLIPDAVYEDCAFAKRSGP